MATLIFIDGPIVGETRTFPGYAPPKISIFLPLRTTWCGCNPNQDAEGFEKASEVVEYHCVSIGIQHQVGMYSIHNEELAVVNALKAWVISDMTGPWNMTCRDRRAFK